MKGNYWPVIVKVVQFYLKVPATITFYHASFSNIVSKDTCNLKAPVRCEVEGLSAQWQI